MKGLYDLPKNVREKIYRTHLVQGDPIKFTKFKAICNRSDEEEESAKKSPRIMPSLLQVSRKIEREASSIYFGENVFHVEADISFDRWFSPLWSRHAQQIRTIILDWELEGLETGHFHLTGDFKKLKSLRALQSLVVAVDEQRVSRPLLHGPWWRKEWHDSLELGPQAYLPMMHVEGMADLRALRGLQNVEFRHPERTEQRGSIPGGFLEAVAKREMMRTADMREYNPNVDGSFRFFDLPPEVRNIVYDMLMVNPGVTLPTRGRPTSVKHIHPFKRGMMLAPPSVLELLRVNHQIHGEAEGVFYSRNNFVFPTPAGLQSFISTLGLGRLDVLRSLTFFYKEGRVGNKPDGLTLMEATLSTLRLLRGLRKLRILVAEPDLTNHHPWTPVPSNMDWTECYPAQLEGASYLFEFRNLDDFQVFGPHTVRRQEHTGPRYAATVKRLDAVFRHFNHGLRLAQKGRIFSELYTNKDWADEERWPALGTETETCGLTKGCSCGQSSDDEDFVE